MSDQPSPRIAPVTRAEWTDEIRDYFRLSEGTGSEGGEPRLNVVLTMAHNPALAMAYRPLGAHLLLTSSLSPRVREMVTLRTAWLCRSDYEWTKHELLARQIGMTDAEIEGIRAGPDAPLWSEFDRHLLRATDQLKNNSDIDDASWQVLARQLDRRQLLDFIFTVGMYAMLAMALNAARVQMEPEGEETGGVGR